MPKFKVYYSELATYRITVEAENEEEVRRIFDTEELPEGYCLGIDNQIITKINRIGEF